MRIIKNIGLSIISVIFSIILSNWVGRVYHSLLNITQGFSSFIVSESVNYYVIGFILAYFLTTVFLFTAFGDKTKYWWIGILLIPAVLFELYFDLEHIYIPIIIGLTGWIVGFIVSKIVGKLKAVSS